MQVTFNAAAIAQHIDSAAGSTLDTSDLQPWTATLGGELPPPERPYVDIAAQSNEDFQRIVSVLRDAVERRQSIDIKHDGVTVSFVPAGIDIMHGDDFYVRVWYGGNDAHDAESRV